MVGSSGKAPIIWLWLTAFFAPASPVRSAELGSWSNGRSDPEPSRGSSRQPVACQSAGKNLSSKTAKLGCLNYLPPSSSAVTSTGLNCGIGNWNVGPLLICSLRTPPVLPSGWEHSDRHLSKDEEILVSSFLLWPRGQRARMRGPDLSAPAPPMGVFTTTPGWSRIFWNSAAAGPPCFLAKYAEPRR